MKPGHGLLSRVRVLEDPDGIFKTRSSPCERTRASFLWRRASFQWSAINLNRIASEVQ